MGRLLDWFTRQISRVEYEEICPTCLSVVTVEFSGYTSDEAKQIKDAVSENVHAFCLGLVKSSEKGGEER